MCIISKVIATGAWAFITPFLSFISKSAAGTTLKFAAIGVKRVPQYPAVNAKAPAITGSAPWENTNGIPIYYLLVL